MDPWDIWKPSPSGKLSEYILTDDVTAFELNATNILSVYIRKYSLYTATITTRIVSVSSPLYCVRKLSKAMNDHVY